MPHEAGPRVPILQPREWLEAADAITMPVLTPAEWAELPLGPVPYLASVENARLLARDWLLLGEQGLLIESLDAQMPVNPVKAHHIAAVDGAIATLSLPGRETRIAEPCVLLGSHPMHYHWLCYFLPRLLAVERHPHLAAMRLVVGDDLSASQQESLRLAGIGEDRLLRLGPDAVHLFDELWVPSMLTWRLAVHPAALRWLRRTYLGTDAPQPRGRRLFVSRRDAALRHVLNEDEVAALLGRHGFETVAAGRLGFGEQARLFSEAEWIAGGTGSGLANIVFAPRGATLVELHNYTAADFFRVLCAELGQRYERLQGEVRPANGVRLHDCDFTVPLAPLEALLARPDAQK